MAGRSRLRPNRLQFAIALTVAVSGGLVAVWAGGSALAIALATVAGLLLGVALTAYLTWIAPSSGAPDGRRRRRP